MRLSFLIIFIDRNYRSGFKKIVENFLGDIFIIIRDFDTE